MQNENDESSKWNPFSDDTTIGDLKDLPPSGSFIISHGKLVKVDLRMYYETNQDIFEQNESFFKGQSTIRGDKIPVTDVRAYLVSNGLFGDQVEKYLDKCSDQEEVDMNALKALNKELAAK